VEGYSLFEAYPVSRPGTRGCGNPGDTPSTAPRGVPEVPIHSGHLLASMLGHPLDGYGSRGTRVDQQRAQALDLAPRTCLNRLDATALPGPHPAMTGSPVDPGPVKQCPAQGRLSYETTHGNQSLGWQFAASISSGHTRGKSAPFRVGPCTPIGPIRGPPSLPPASLTGSAVPLAWAWATPGAYALHGPGERVRLTTFRQLHRRG
jgi:hypothetical protein